jgi:hypothetical protein
MNKVNLSGLLLLTIFAITSCSSIPDRPWSDAIPEKAPFVILPQQDATLNDVLQSSYSPFLDDITSSAIQLLSRVDSTADDPVTLNGIMLYPGANNQLETVWMAQTEGKFIQLMKNNFYRDFTQNQYYFKEVVVHILHLGDRRLFAAQLNNSLLISESSLGVEDAIRAYTGSLTRLDLDDVSPEPGHIIMNTPSMDGWFQQLSKVGYRPVIKKALAGTSPTLLQISQTGEQQNTEFQLSGEIGINKDESSNLVATFASGNAPVTLDRYISSNAAAFGLFRLPPRLAAPTSLPDTTRLDSTLMNNQEIYAGLAQTLDQEFGLVMYAQSGFLSTGEHLFVRKVKDVAGLRQQLSSLANDDQIQQQESGSYFIRSAAVAKLIGSSLCTFQDFYLDVTGEAVVISKRKGLAEIVASDRNRRRTIFYEQTFRDIKQNLPDEISSLFVANAEFESFITPFLAPDNYLNALTSKFDILTVSTTLSDNQESLTLSINTYRTEDRTAPYQEKWLFPTGGPLSGKPVLADIGGSDRDEIIFATEAGNIYALAADGTVVMQGNTGSDTPIGSPVVYDWYATNQNVILLAAGDKIYGWNDNGQSLPKFPFQLDEKITSPLVINDIDRNGLPDAIVATADRELHVLNGRGNDISGWPVTTNAEIKTAPNVKSTGSTNTILAFSENAVHSWSADGNQRKGFPKFLNASLNGSPTNYDGNILGNAADGYLYSIGPDKMFADSLNVFETSAESSEVEAIYASNSALLGTPSVHDLTVTTDGQTYSEPMMLTMSSNGSVFLINTSGQLRFTKSMGQPSASSFSPFITDINQNNQEDIVALASFGRLYVWEIATGKRIYSVPTSAMEHPIVTDIDEDGYQELIAQTQQGLRTWTIFGGQTESGNGSDG